MELPQPHRVADQLGHVIDIHASQPFARHMYRYMYMA